MDLLRFSTAGSVDDGKSTLIGRMLYDSKAIPDDQYEAIRRASNEDEVNLALLTDGLRAEREQMITIDVAYRYFATPRRRFIIADTPGHAQYTRNMVTGASTAQAAVILVDARKGRLEQSRRHAALSALLRVPHLVLAVNKMDLVDFDEQIFRQIEAEFALFARKLGTHATAIPLSALTGDNVVERSRRMPFFQGPALLEHLETLPIPIPERESPFRFPVQCVIRPHQSFRGFAGRVAGGHVRPGDPLVVLPSGLTTSVASILTADGTLEQAQSGDSVILTLTDECDISRGDLLAHPETAPSITRRFAAMVCILNEAGLRVGAPYLVAHTTRLVGARVERLEFRLEVETLERTRVTHLALNELGRIQVSVTQPLLLDRYDENRGMGGFVLIDPATHLPVAAGMIEELLPDVDEELCAEPWNQVEREQRHGHLGGVITVPDRPTAAQWERQLALEGWHTAFLESEAQSAAPALIRNGYVVLLVGSSSVPLDEQVAALRFPTR